MDHIITDPALFDHIIAKDSPVKVTPLSIPVASPLTPSTPEQTAARAEWLTDQDGVWSPNEKAKAIIEAAGDVLNPALDAACELDAITEMWTLAMEVSDPHLTLCIEEASDKAADRFVAAIKLLAA